MLKTLCLGVASLALASLTSADTPIPLIVAHRGECFIAPENTMASFNLAWKHEDPAIELDIHLTGDGQVVVCHDLDTARTSATHEKVVMKDATLAEIQKVDIGSFKGPEYAGEHCPTLADVYAAMPDGRKCYTEIKSGIDVVPAFVEVYRKSGKKPEQVVVISFHADALEASKKALPELKHYLLANYKQDKKTGKWGPPGVEEWIETAKKIKADGLDLGANAGLDEAACKKVIASGLELHVWTTEKITVAKASVDDPAIARQYANWGALSITTNRSAFVSEQLRSSAK